MSSNTEVVIAQLERIDGGDLDAFADGLEPECDWQTPGAVLRGPAEIAAHLRTFAATFANQRHEVVTTVETGDVVAVEGVWTAVHTGPFPLPAGDLPATGRHVALPFAAVVRLRDGRVASNRVYFDTATLVASLTADDPGSTPLEVVERFRAAFEAGDLATLESLMAPDIVVRNPFGTMHGPAEFLPLADAFVSAIGERRIEVLSAFASGSSVAVELRVAGRHTGTLAMAGAVAPPTGEPVVFEEAGIVQVAGGRILSWRSYYDGHALMQTLGVLPEPAAVA